MNCPQSLTVVVPCYNESTGLAQLQQKLEDLQRSFESSWNMAFVLVDDGSTDGTWESLQDRFAAWPNAVLVRHARNQGVAGALLTGIRQAQTEIVCSMDSDCTYDPVHLPTMARLLGPGVDLVTASPYHPYGHVENVPSWRLALSRGASMLYRLVLPTKLHTYTSCFRAYRRNAVVDLPLRYSGFQGVAELLGRVSLQGSGIIEFPTTLSSRRHGRSKMKIAATILGHLRLVGFFVALRLWNLAARPRSAPRSPLPSAPPPSSVNPAIVKGP